MTIYRQLFEMLIKVKLQKRLNQIQFFIKYSYNENNNFNRLQRSFVKSGYYCFFSSTKSLKA